MIKADKHSSPHMLIWFIKMQCTHRKKNWKLRIIASAITIQWSRNYIYGPSLRPHHGDFVFASFPLSIEWSHTRLAYRKTRTAIYNRPYSYTQYWLCACVRYWPDLGLVFECVTFMVFFCPFFGIFSLTIFIVSAILIECHTSSARRLSRTSWFSSSLKSQSIVNRIFVVYS